MIEKVLYNVLTWYDSATVGVASDVSFTHSEMLFPAGLTIKEVRLAAFNAIKLIDVKRISKMAVFISGTSAREFPTLVFYHGTDANDDFFKSYIASREFTENRG